MRPFELTAEVLEEHIEDMAAVTISDLTSEFLILPRGSGFLEYHNFRDAYSVLSRYTSGFQTLERDQIWAALLEDSRVFCVVRAILGMTPPEWAELAKSTAGSDVTQGAAREFDGCCRRDSGYVQATVESGRAKKTPRRLKDMINVAAKFLTEGAPLREEGIVRRMDQFDTRYGLESIRHAAQEHVPYAALLYERYLGRPFASHRDAVSELVGEVMESAVEDQLREANIPYRKTKRAERIPGFDQAPDFCIPDEIAPTVIIEAKITSDDGTARDKATRIIRLALDRDNHAREGRNYQVVACVDGRGFSVRTEDMKQMLLALQGKVFTAATLDQLIEHTRLRDFLPQEG